MLEFIDRHADFFAALIVAAVCGLGAGALVGALVMAGIVILARLDCDRRPHRRPRHRPF